MEGDGRREGIRHEGRASQPVFVLPWYHRHGASGLNSGLIKSHGSSWDSRSVPVFYIHY